jgi:hypothetical protein
MYGNILCISLYGKPDSLTFSDGHQFVEFFEGISNENDVTITIFYLASNGRYFLSLNDAVTGMNQSHMSKNAPQL